MMKSGWNTSSYLLKHSSDVDLSSLIPPPPTATGRSPPTISVSSKEHPAPDFLLPGGLPAGPVLVDGVQNPSPEPQYPNLRKKNLHYIIFSDKSYPEQQG